MKYTRNDMYGEKIDKVEDYADGDRTFEELNHIEGDGEKQDIISSNDYEIIDGKSDGKIEVLSENETLSHVSSFNDQLYNDSEGYDIEYQNYLYLVNLNKSIDEHIKNYQERLKGLVPTFDLTYTLNRSPEAHINIPNELVLDNPGYYYIYESDSIKIDGRDCKTLLDDKNLPISIKALHCDKTINFRLKSVISPESSELSTNLINECNNIKYGFELSEVMKNIGRISKISPNVLNNNTKEACLTITQRAFFLKNRNQIIFNFYFENKGFEYARRILFKDVLPPGVILNLNGIYINSCLCPFENVNIDGQKILVKIPDIERMGSLILTLVCSLCGDHPHGQVNIGAVSYVSKYVVKLFKSDILHINQSISNSKSIDSILYECKTHFDQFRY